MVRDELKDLGFNKDEIDAGGLRVTTTFDEQAQDAAQTAATEGFPPPPNDGVKMGSSRSTRAPAQSSRSTAARTGSAASSTTPRSGSRRLDDEGVHRRGRAAERLHPVEHLQRQLALLHRGRRRSRSTTRAEPATGRRSRCSTPPSSRSTPPSSTSPSRWGRRRSPTPPRDAGLDTDEPRRRQPAGHARVGGVLAARHGQRVRHLRRTRACTPSPSRCSRSPTPTAACCTRPRRAVGAGLPGRHRQRGDLRPGPGGDQAAPVPRRRTSDVRRPARPATTRAMTAWFIGYTPQLVTAVAFHRELRR